MYTMCFDLEKQKEFCVRGEILAGVDCQLASKFNKSSDFCLKNPYGKDYWQAMIKIFN